ncbi:MAG: Uma2 family endonuclease [Bacteroidota bacterium]
MQTATIDRSKEWTVEDYLQLEEGLLAQLINGELIMTPAPHPDHQLLSGNLNEILRGVFKQKGKVFYSPIDLYLDKKNIFQPDLLYVSNENSGIITDRGVEGPPDLIVEILSPSNHFVDRYSKKKAYLDFGVKEYWMIDYNNKTFESYLNTQGNRDVPHLYLSSNGKVKSPNFKEIDFEFEKLF